MLHGSGQIRDSSQLDYKWPGAQSTTRKIQEKLSEGRISLEDFEGALPDGVTDCSASISAIIDTAMNLGVIGDRQRRRRVVLNSGQYRFTAPIEIGNIQDLAIIGAGPEMTSLLIDHSDGHGINYTGTGNALFQGFTIYASTARNAGAFDETQSGFVSDPGVSATTLMVRLKDVFSYRHPGKGICLINPELSLVDRCRAANNKGRGLHMWGRNLANICNEVRRFRSRNNSGVGIHWENLDSGKLVFCESLNNAQGVSGEYQVRVEGAVNSIEQIDVEMYDYVTSSTDYRGLLITGRGNENKHGQFYGLNLGLHCVSAKGTIIQQIKLEGKSGATMAKGVVLDSVSGGCTVSVGQKNLVTTLVDDASTGSTIIPYVA